MFTGGSCNTLVGYLPWSSPFHAASEMWVAFSDRGPDLTMSSGRGVGGNGGRVIGAARLDSERSEGLGATTDFLGSQK